MKAPLWFEIVGRIFVIIVLPTQAWVLFFRLHWLNRSWERFHLRLTQGAANVIGILFLAAAAYEFVRLVLFFTGIYGLT
jgi:hypothetical protein